MHVMFKNRRTSELKQKIRELEKENQELRIENNGLYDDYNQIVEEYNQITELCKFEYPMIKDLKSENKELINENSRLKNQISDIKEEIKIIRLEKLNLREELKKEKSNWIIEADSGWRINQITGKREEYKIPYDFNIEMVRDLKFSKEGKFRKFKYYDKYIPGERFGSWRFFTIARRV